jgi:hypothetical protein
MPSNAGGRGKCSICAHPEVEVIEQALLQGTALDTVAARFGLTSSSLRRHKVNHPRRDLVNFTTSPTETTNPAARGWLKGELDAQFNRTLAEVKAAEKSGSSSAIQGAHREHRQTLAAIVKWEAEQEKLELLRRPAGVINVLKTPQWQMARWILLEELTPYPELRLRIVNRLEALEARGDTK